MMTPRKLASISREGAFHPSWLHSHIMNQKDRSNRRTGMEGREGGPRREGGGEEEEENSDHENFEIYDFPVFTFFSKRKKSFGEYFSLRSVKPRAIGL